MLDAVALEGLHASIIHPHRQSHGDGAFRVQHPLAQVGFEFEIVRDHLELFSGHRVGGVGVDIHGPLVLPRMGGAGYRAFTGW